MSPIGVDRRAEYERAITFEDFLSSVDANRDLWNALALRATVSDAAVERAAQIPGQFHFLVLLEDWCGDTVNTVPVLARLAERVPSITLRVLKRDENLTLTDEHLTSGKRAIPIVIVLDEHMREVACWGPRPRELQQWHLTEGVMQANGERHRAMRRWYAVDRGRSTIDEILKILCKASSAPDLCLAA